MISSICFFYKMFAFLYDFFEKYFVSFNNNSNSSEDLEKDEDHANPIHEESKQLIEEDKKEPEVKKVPSWENFYLSFF